MTTSNPRTIRVFANESGVLKFSAASSRNTAMAVQRGDGRLLALIKDTRAGGCCVLMATPHKAAQKLTPKQTLFVAEYLVDHNGKQAAIRAGYAPRSAEMQASRLC